MSNGFCAQLVTFLYVHGISEFTLNAELSVKKQFELT